MELWSEYANHKSVETYTVSSCYIIVVSLSIVYAAIRSFGALGTYFRGCCALSDRLLNEPRVVTSYQDKNVSITISANSVISFFEVKCLFFPHQSVKKLIEGFIHLPSVIKGHANK